MTCRVSKQSGLAKLLQATKLIIWDETPMSKRQTIEAFDKLLQDVTECSLPFGGKVVVFGGDFRQVLPVVPRATRQEIIDASLVKSQLWPKLQKIKLTENMRAKLDPTFSEYLLRIGNGTEPTTLDDKVKLPIGMIVSYTDDIISLNALIDFVFLDINDYPNKLDLMINRAILTPKNDCVDEINNLLIDRFPGEVTRYYSFDETIEKNDQTVQEDFLNSLTPNGLPPHELVLKPKCPVILLRNIYPSEGLCNGTRLICCQFKPNVIDAEIAVGHYRGKRVFIPRIPFLPAQNENYPFPFKRTQFPFRLSFAMTINKAQGQTLDYVGVYLPRPVFSHGQLYVAFSRAKTADSVKVLLRPTSIDESDENCTQNIVYEELLALAELC